MKRLIGGLAAAAVLVWAPPSPAYEIYPLRPVHEAMTRLAYQCLEAGEEEPLDCRAAYARLPDVARHRLVRSFTNREKAASWPDDPSREISPLTAIRYGLAIQFTCARKADRNPAFTLAEGGLMCSSHYGALQFLHAMRSSSGEGTEDTRARILDWAMLSYGVAAGQIAVDQPYCGYFRGQTGSSIAVDLAPPDFAFCEERVESGRRIPGWRLQTLFALRCGNALLSRRCSEITGPEGARLARESARGAVLHLIQDSYSQSHAARGPSEPGGAFISIVDCSLPTAFHFYTGDTATAHRQADSPPDATRNCEGGETADAITASAELLRFIDRSAPASEVRLYLETQVFGSVGGRAHAG